MLLEVKNIKKNFGKIEVLKGIDFSLDEGQVLAIIGSSGSGKTTLLRCLNFLEQADEGVMQEVLNDEDKLNARIYRFPTSMIKNNDIKISYYDFLCSASNEDCNEALKRIVPRIQMDEIDAFIDDIEPLTELQKSFYKRYLAGRYEKILLPAYAQVMDESEEESLTIKPL